MTRQQLIELATKYGKEKYGKTHQTKWNRMAATLGKSNGYQKLSLFEIRKRHRIDGKRWIPFLEWAETNNKKLHLKEKDLEWDDRIEYSIDNYGNNPSKSRGKLLVNLKRLLSLVEKGEDVDISDSTAWMITIFDIADSKDTKANKELLAAPLRKLVFYKSNPDYRPPSKDDYGNWLDSIDLKKVPTPAIRSNLTKRVWPLKIARRIYKMYETIE